MHTVRKTIVDADGTVIESSSVGSSMFIPWKGVDCRMSLHCSVLQEKVDGWMEGWFNYWVATDAEVAESVNMRKARCNVFGFVLYGFEGLMKPDYEIEGQTEEEACLAFEATCE